MVFYRYNPFSGRIMPAQQMAALNPQGINPAAAAEAAKTSEFRFDSKLTKPVSVAPAMAADGGLLSVEARGVVPRSPTYQSLMKLQKEWAVDDGLLVWQKRGMRDKVPLWVTFGMMGVGLTYAFTILYKMSFPAPPSED